MLWILPFLSALGSFFVHETSLPTLMSPMVWRENQLSRQEKQLESHILTVELSSLPVPPCPSSLHPYPSGGLPALLPPVVSGFTDPKHADCHLLIFSLVSHQSPRSKYPLAILTSLLDPWICRIAAWHIQMPLLSPHSCPSSFVSAALTPIGCLDPAGQSTHLPHHCPHCPGNLCSTECFSGNLAPSSAQPP